MAFTIHWRSTGGYWQSLFPTPTHLADYPNERAEPGSGSTSEMALWAPFNTDYGGGTVNIPAFSSMEGISFTTADMFSYLTQEKILCEFEVADSPMAPTGGKVCLALKGEIVNQDNLYIRPSRRIYGAQGQLITESIMGADSIIGLNTDIMYKVLAGSFIRNNVSYLGLGMIKCNADGLYAEGSIYYNTPDNFTVVFGGTPSGEEISPEYGPESQPGGYNTGGPSPTFDGTSDTWVDTPTKPGVLSFGLLNVYKCDQGALNNLGADLFPEITWPPSTGFSDLLEWLGETIQAFSDSVWNKGLIDYIVSVHLIPVDVSGGALEDIKIGPRTMTGILARPISNDVIEIDCGTVHVDEYYTNYVDYMTQCRVYIPYYGMVSIKPEYWQSADISLKYLWNVLDGSFIAKLYSTITRHQSPCTTLIGQYSGSACVHMPLSGANYANMFAQLAGGLGGAAAGIASGNVAMAATSAMNYAGSIGGVGNMEQSNAYNASSAFYGHARPFLLIERPVSHFSRKYVDECGLPVLVTKRIGACSGLTICEDPILNFACPDDEAKAIKAALREGVIV